ncbi:multipass membrane protein [Candidatus Mancarchaeum acidiphilum]|uniref:Multipass membrane protein n=1 Tax=Candidatus Mancarchaeum acidiphilum TaxID=1920749 RepID=A0A218NMX1_9ARCH|nr:hypothetical protein [Candidatus Mancarchaeum acidiphilum]ASI13794.1 multipass membrane protein [Candidatus Mancarchaeum acidiphilum]
MIGSALKFVYSEKRYLLSTIAIAILMGALYYYLVHIGGLFYPIIFGSIALGEITDIAGFALISVLMGISISMQIYSYKLTRLDDSKGETAIAVITGVFAQGLCCTPIVGSLLAMLGLSTSALLTLSGAISHTFAVLEPILIIASILLLLYSIRSTAKSLLYCSKRELKISQKTKGG